MSHGVILTIYDEISMSNDVKIMPADIITMSHDVLTTLNDVT